VTTEGNVTANATPEEMQTTTSLSSNMISITEDTDINNNVHNTSNMFYNEEQVYFAENISATLSEFMTTFEYTTTVLNAINSAKLNNTNDSITLKTFINLNNSKDNISNSKKNSTSNSTTDNFNINIENATNKNTFISIPIEQNITENNSQLDKNNVNSDTQTNTSIDSDITTENIKLLKEQNRTTDNSTILHINKFTHFTDANIFNSIITDSDLNNDEQNVSSIKVNETSMDINSNTKTSEEVTTGMTIHESTFDTIITESYTKYTTTIENKNDWIFTEEEDDDANIIPEMPTIASDPLALKELPRPMTIEDEESG
jgi:hypothetical protein